MAMDKEKMITWALELQGISKVDLARKTHVTSGTVSKLGKQKKPLAEQKLDEMLDMLHIDVDVTADDIRFKEGSFVKILIRENLFGFPKYAPLFEVMELHRGGSVNVIMVEADDLPRCDELFQTYVMPEVPAAYMVVEIRDHKLLLFVRRKRAYLTYRSRVESVLRERYGATIVSVRDRGISWDQADEVFVRALLERHTI